jgi:hypothetical protein
MILKLVLAAGLILLTLFAMLRLQRYLKGESGSLFEGKPKRKESTEGPNDLEQFIESYRREKANSGGAAAPAAVESAATPAAATAGAHATVRADTPAARRAFLTGPSKLLYLVLKAGLPDHHVFANCRLSDVLDPPPQGWAEARVDFVVCRNDLQVVAAIELSVPGAPDAGRRTLAQPLAAAGIRYLRMQPPALPKPADVRRLIYPA